MEAFDAMTLDMARHLVPEPVETTELKRCTFCGKEHTLAQYRALKLIGFIGDFEQRCEMRNCACGGTMGITVEHGKVVRLNG